MYLPASGDNAYLYFFGNKPETVVADTAVGTVDGYHVFTTTELQGYGIGYVVRWRVSNWASIFTVPQGPWRSPEQGWPNDAPMPSVHGLPFWAVYRVFSIENGSGGGQSFVLYNNGNESRTYDAWVQSRDSIFLDWPGYFPNRLELRFIAEVQIRYVLIAEPASIFPSSELDFTYMGGVNLVHDVVTVSASPDSCQPATQKVQTRFLSLTLYPRGTCTTPSIQEATVKFRTIFESEIPNQGDATEWVPFELIFRDCPRTFIQYYIHTNGKWLDSANSRSIVGMPGSAPNVDPVIGNPRGFGIQLYHNGGQGGTGRVIMGAGDKNSNWYNDLLWYGAGAENLGTGVTHTIPLRARVIRTSPTNTPIVPGPFNTSVVFVIHYP